MLKPSPAGSQASSKQNDQIDLPCFTEVRARPGRDMGLVNRKETPAVGHVLGSDVVSESGWRQLAFNGFKPPPPPTSHKSNYLTVGERFNWALLIV